MPSLGQQGMPSLGQQGMPSLGQQGMPSLDAMENIEQMLLWCGFLQRSRKTSTKWSNIYASHLLFLDQPMHALAGLLHEVGAD
jgi:hypothetical protein